MQWSLNITTLFAFFKQLFLIRSATKQWWWSWLYCRNVLCRLITTTINMITCIDLYEAIFGRDTVIDWDESFEWHNDPDLFLHIRFQSVAVYQCEDNLTDLMIIVPYSNRSQIYDDDDCFRSSYNLTNTNYSIFMAIYRFQFFIAVAW
jgi:hypothetical protein